MYRTEYDPKVIGQNLKRCRKAKNLTVEQVRKYMRLGTTQAVYKWESGKSYPPADSLLALMELYNAEFIDIVGKSQKVCEFGLMIGLKNAEKQLYQRLFMYHRLFANM